MSSVHGDMSSVHGDMSSVHGDMSSVHGDMSSVHGLGISTACRVMSREWRGSSNQKQESSHGGGIF
jgi:hypothetical protein